MSATVVLNSARTLPLARLLDFVELTKPRIAMLALLTVGVGGVVASRGSTPGWIILHAIFGTALVAASASVMNHWLERRLDRRMARTGDRPLAAGRVSTGEAFIFAGMTLSLGLVYLLTLVNGLTAGLGLLTWLLYVGVYTPLKVRTSWNTAIGAIPGALPAVMGWTALGAPLGPDALVLFFIIYLWQFPHFMAIAWLYRDDYARAGMKMLPVVDPTGRLTPVSAVLHALVLAPVSLAPAVAPWQWTGMSYFAGALTLGLGYVAFAVWFLYRTNESSARGLLRASLVYLPSLLILLMLDLRAVSSVAAW